MDSVRGRCIRVCLGRLAVFAAVVVVGTVFGLDHWWGQKSVRRVVPGVVAGRSGWVCDGSGVVESKWCQNDAGILISVFSRCFGAWLVGGGGGCVGSGGSKFRPRDRARTQNF